jgi:5-oxoprolinase (ATP-hydrolysing)
MPPHAKSLEEEGVVFEPAFLVRGGKVDWSSIEKILTSCAYPTRRLKENLSDLEAQLASIRLGESELRKMVRCYGLDMIRQYMASLMQRAAGALRSALAGLTFEAQAAEEYLDNDAPIAVRIRRLEDRLVIDYAGSAEAQKTSYNATPAIVKSATLYVLRLLANQSIPLNEGFMDVVDINSPEGMLSPRFDQDPAFCPPVVAGNVEVSQRIVDTLLKAFGLAACSQGTMNNLIFGNRHFSYYETIAGGEGATSTGPGADGVHTHMTNTGITDPEILEFRFPVTLEAFEIREHSGGAGKCKGGEGLRRRIRFNEPVVVSLLTQHRKYPPFGLEGGMPGALGSQCRITLSGEKKFIEGNGSFSFEAGEAIEILTPGGGGWGSETG